MKKLLFLLLGVTFLISCNDDKGSENPTPEKPEVNPDTLAIYFINDQHGQIDNFAKVKYIVDGEKETNEHVLLVCAGDIFTGNPIVDQYEEKGYPMIDLMNKTGFDISVVGNHEFDYGPDVLKKRMEQAEFPWICANVDTKASGVPQPDPYKTLEVGDLKVTFLGLLETYGGTASLTIPSSHPDKVSEMSFVNHNNVVSEYTELKSEENSDVFIALTHLGASADRDLASDHSMFDAIIGGHSHSDEDEVVNNTPIVQAGSYLNTLGKLQLIVAEGEVLNHSVEKINLNTYSNYDQELKELIDQYNDVPELDEAVGFATNFLDRIEIGCFYTTALKEYYQTDASFQNSGGIRANFNEGVITLKDVFNMDPFNNGTAVFTLTAQEVARFFSETGIGLHVSGLQFSRDQQELIIRDEQGNIYDRDATITIAINDYIPAIYTNYFPKEKAEYQELTTAESIIQYLETINQTIDVEDCNRYYRYVE